MIARDKLTPAERLRLDRLAREIKITDRILSDGLLERLDLEDHGPAPAWTSLDGTRMGFDLSKMPLPVSGRDVAVWLGTNAHELGHVRHSPRAESNLMLRVIAADRSFLPGLARLHNIVEDQRQERRTLGEFAAWRGYLVAALAHHLRGDQPESWLLMCGRTWLDPAVRASARAACVAAHGEDTARDTSALIDAYQRLDDPGEGQSDQAWSILERLHTLYDLAIPPGGGCGSGPPSEDAGEPSTDPVSGQAPPPADDADDTGTPDADADQDADTGDQDQDATDAQDGPGAQDGPSTAPDSQDGPDGQPGQSDGQQDATPSVSDLLDRDADAQTSADTATGADLDRVLDGLDHGPTGADDTAQDTPGQWVDLPDSARRLHRDIAAALTKLRDRSEAGWIRRTDGGRLHGGRFVTVPDDPDVWFDRFDPGQMDATDLEAVVLLDVSTSMSGSMAALGEAAWAIHRAVDDLEGRLTVITWSSGPHRVMVRPGTPANRSRMFVPGVGDLTVPGSALEDAYRRLAGSQAANRLMVVLTDGRWPENRADGQLIAAMRAAGIVTVCGLLGAGAGDDGHGCEFWRQLAQVADLARLFSDVAAGVMADRAAGRR